MFSTFNPSAMPSELVEGTFVQRVGLAERLVDIFDDSARRESKHNVLLVGPRGIGKSHLVSLVYHRLKAKADLSEKLLIAYLREDEWGVTSFLDLLVRTLRAAFEEAGIEPPASTRDLSKLSRSQAEDHVWRSLQEMLGAKTLLVIIENLDAVFQKIGEQGQRQWRALIQTHPQWAILATTPALFSDISRQVAPFYGFFEVIHLQPLSLDEAVALLRKLARCNADEKTEAFLKTAIGRARVRAVQHLAGGNHRIFVLFYEFLRQGGSEHFVTPLLKAIDALTPYYQSQMARLSPQQQKIVNLLCEYRRPATVTTIATDCFMTHQTAASQLRHLLTARYVRVDRVGREAFYELAEPLLRICVEGKGHRDRPLNLLVDFIRYWFSREELERKLSGASDRDPGRDYLAAALKEYDVEDAHVHLEPQIGLLCRALRAGHPSEELRLQAEELAELSKIAQDWVHYTKALIYLNRGQEALPTLEKELQENPDSVTLLRAIAGVHTSVGSLAVAGQFLDRAIAQNPSEGLVLMDRGELLAATHHYDEALEAYEQAEFFDPSLVAMVAVDKAAVLINKEEYKAVRKVLSPFLAEGERIPGVFFSYGLAFGHEGKHEKALEYFTKAAAAFENHATAWGNKGVALCKLDRYPEALEALERSLALDSKGDKVFRHSLCEAFLETKQYATAVEKSSPEDLSHNIFHHLLKIVNLGPKQGRLQQQLMELKNAHDSAKWQNAFLGGLIEFASYAAHEFDEREDIKVLQIWNSALQELFAKLDNFSILLKLFDVLTRVKVFNDKKALLELPWEQRTLLIGEQKDEDFLNSSAVRAPEPLGEK